MPDDLPSLNKEKLTLTDDQLQDPSLRAEAVLDHILNADREVVKQADGTEVEVSEALRQRPVLDLDTGRTQSRVLFITTDENVLLPDSNARQEYLKLSEHFDEVHVMCLIARLGTESFDRASDNIWFYQIRSKYWWKLPWAAKSAAREALTWNNVFRADVVVAIDPFEAGLAGYLLAKKYRRPLQFHIATDPFAPDFNEKAPDNNWRASLANFLLKRAKSVRVTTSNLKQVLQKRYRKLADLEVLPRFYNFTGLLNAAPTFDLHQRYPDYAFIMLAFGPMTADSYLHDLFTALHRLLKNPHIGLIVIGDGPAKTLFEEKVKLLSIEKNVVFKKEMEDMVSYLKTANALVEMSVAEDGEVRVLQAAAAGLPVVAKATDLRQDLFEDGVSAFLAESDDLMEISQKVSKLINNVAVRKQFSENGLSVAMDRLHEDPNAHYLAIRDTIESVLAVDANIPSSQPNGN